MALSLVFATLEGTISTMEARGGGIDTTLTLTLPDIHPYVIKSIKCTTGSDEYKYVRLYQRPAGVCGL
jgi:hypothetical protein